MSCKVSPKYEDFSGRVIFFRDDKSFTVTDAHGGALPEGYLFGLEVLEGTGCHSYTAKEFVLYDNILTP